ncbi:MAG: hypothetical protein Ct9H300mP22_3420 [Gammaproteobacteria bacterium]|nr:MAG: hypothetical protein Ct9H300mP22_3420 [Gammaproteobacteria bacterium]
MVYGTRFETNTGLRVRKLESGDDQWLTYPIQRDTQENFRPSTGACYLVMSSPDGDAIILSRMVSFSA